MISFSCRHRQQKSLNVPPPIFLFLLSQTNSQQSVFWYYSWLYFFWEERNLDNLMCQESNMGTEEPVWVRSVLCLCLQQGLKEEKHMNLATVCIHSLCILPLNSHEFAFHLFLFGKYTDTVHYYYFPLAVTSKVCNPPVCRVSLFDLESIELQISVHVIKVMTCFYYQPMPL